MPTTAGPQDQRTGTPQYAGEQDNDSRTATDCATVSAAARTVTAPEFEVFAD